MMIKKTIAAAIIQLAISLSLSADPSGQAEPVKTSGEKNGGSAYEITKSKTDQVLSIALLPLSVHVNDDKTAAYFVSGEIDFTPNFPAGLSARADYSVYGIMLENETRGEKSKYRNFECGIKLKAFESFMPKNVDFRLGNRYGKFFPFGSYYATCQAPVKTRANIRLGIISQEMVITDRAGGESGTERNFEENRKSITVYGGIEINTIHFTEIRIHDEQIEKKFGSSFSEKKISKLYIDYLHSISDRGDIKISRKAGFRLGYLYRNKTAACRMEFGISPASGKFASVSVGKGLDF